MELIRGLHNLHPRHRGCVLTIGNFDGVHLGHRAVLEQLAREARTHDLPSVAMLFEPQPAEFFAPEQAPSRLMRLREKLSALRGMVDRVLCVRFDARFAALSADDFVQRVLVDGLGVRFLVVGDDFRFGHRRQGDFACLGEAGRRHGFSVERQQTFSVAGQRVSSTRIRLALAEGRLEDAAELLGGEFSLSGRVAHGFKRGRTIGFPTANIYLHRHNVPVQGVYAVQVAGVDGRPRPGVANLGTRPTVDGSGTVPLLEVHLFDYSGDLYGRHVSVTLRHRLRDEKRFDSFELLRQQIQRDAAAAREILAVAPTTG